MQALSYFIHFLKVFTRKKTGIRQISECANKIFKIFVNNFVETNFIEKFHEKFTDF